jgi:hypothetical protein
MIQSLDECRVKDCPKKIKIKTSVKRIDLKGSGGGICNHPNCPDRNIGIS